MECKRSNLYFTSEYSQSKKSQIKPSLAQKHPIQYYDSGRAGGDANAVPQGQERRLHEDGYCVSNRGRSLSEES